VFGVRIDAAGNVMDAVPIQLPLSGPQCTPPFGSCFGFLSLAFAASSDSYLVCNGGCVRVASSGTLLDANPIPSLPSGRVLSDGQDHFVVAGGQIFSVDPDATVEAHPFPFAILGDSVASDGDNFLAFTSLGGAPAEAAPPITLFDSNGAVLKTSAMPFQPLGRAVTFDGDEYLIFWTGAGPDGNGKYVTQVSSDGEVLDTSARLALPNFGSGSLDRLFRISFDGMNAVAAWCQSSISAVNSAPIAVIRKDDQAEDQITATQVGTAGPLGSPPRQFLAVASNSTGVSVVIVDGFKFFPPAFALQSFFPRISFVRTWTPSP
jgi:hypothetical protein